MRRATAAASILALLLAGCTSATSLSALPDDDNPPPPDDVQPVTTPAGEPEIPPVVQPEFIYHGKFEVSSYLDIAGSGVLGTKISGTLVALSEFHDNPAGTILDLLALYETPYFTQVWNALPGFIQGYIEEWLNDNLFALIFDNVPIVDKAVQVVDDIATLSRNMELVTELSLERPDSTGRMDGHHELRGVAFTLWGNRAFVAIPAVVTQLVDADPGAKLTKPTVPSATTPDATLDVDDHVFGIPFGEMLIQAANQLIFQPLGATDLRDFLGQMVRCHNVAEWLGDRCVAGQCVNDFVSVAQLEGMCNEGLDLLANTVLDQILALNLDVLRLNDGRCGMWDVGEDDLGGDYKISTLKTGKWAASISFLGNTYEVANNFQGKRIADLP